VKINLNKKVLGQMDERVATLVSEWAARYHKRAISVQDRDSLYVPEDARVTLLNLATGASGQAQAAGDFAGMTSLSPNARVPLPVGVVAVVTGFFCGVPFCEITQGTGTPSRSLTAGAPELQEVKP
jgi:hypothetical protein